MHTSDISSLMRSLDRLLALGAAVAWTSAAVSAKSVTEKTKKRNYSTVIIVWIIQILVPIQLVAKQHPITIISTTHKYKYSFQLQWVLIIPTSITVVCETDKDGQNRACNFIRSSLTINGTVDKIDL